MWELKVVGLYVVGILGCGLAPINHGSGHIAKNRKIEPKMYTKYESIYVGLAVIIIIYTSFKFSNRN